LTAGITDADSAAPAMAMSAWPGFACPVWMMAEALSGPATGQRNPRGRNNDPERV